MKEPIQNTSADIEKKQLKEGDEPFVTASKIRKYVILFLAEHNKYSQFYCSDYEASATYDIPLGAGGIGVMTGEWVFLDVIMDTSKRDAEGRATLVRMTYHPQISLVNIPFMVLPAAGEKENSVEQTQAEALRSDQAEALRSMGYPVGETGKDDKVAALTKDILEGRIRE
jgi:hypothetical protein